ncbi:MAG TPA: LysE family transporter [Jiangellales bacterium]|nr:LysE family transporter [Jiangellales bacterium]
MSSLLLGTGLGLVVAAQPGPVSLLLVRTAARGRRAAGIALGAAVAVVDLLYAGLGAAGVAPMLRAEPLRLVLGLVGAAVLLVIGGRTLWSAWRFRAGLEVPAEVSAPSRAFATGFAATASNPLTIASWAALFAAATVAGAASTASGAVLLVIGVGLGSLLWCTVLALGASALVSRWGDRWVRGLEVVAGVGLVGFGAALGLRSLGQEPG